MDRDSIDAIIAACSKKGNINEVLTFAGITPKGSHDEFCLDFAERVARRYVDNDLEFQSADAAMNWLFAYSYVTDDCPGEMPLPAWQVYEAFDDGEYFHPDDEPSEDPIEKYTTPQIKNIIESCF